MPRRWRVRFASVSVRLRHQQPYDIAPSRRATDLASISHAPGAMGSGSERSPGQRPCPHVLHGVAHIISRRGPDVPAWPGPKALPMSNIRCYCRIRTEGPATIDEVGQAQRGCPARPSAGNISPGEWWRPAPSASTSVHCRASLIVQRLAGLGDRCAAWNTSWRLT